MLGKALIGGSIGSSLLNTAMQYQNLKYQKEVQKEMWRREDNAVQRRVADLKAAGMSPVLAAGQGADAGPTVSTQPPQTDLANDVMNILTMQQNIAQSISQQKLNAEAVKTQETQQAVNRNQAKKLKEEGRYAKHEADFYEGKPFVKNMSPVGKMSAEVQSYIEWIKNKLNKGKEPQVEEPKIKESKIIKPRKGYQKGQSTGVRG